MMRKKTMAFLMAGMMIFGGTMPVFAETETQSGSDTIVWSYEDIDPELYEGEWISFDYGFDLYLPTEWTEASDEETENIVYKLDSPDKKISLAITCNTSEDMGAKAELDAVKKNLETQGFTGLADVEINNIPVVGFDDEENKVSGIAFVGESGNMYTILIGPLEDEDSQTVAANILKSFSETETDAESES